MNRSKLGDRIIEHGPFRAGDFNHFRHASAEEVEELRHELLTLRNILGLVEGAQGVARR